MNLSTICDINYGDKKFIGSAQYRRNTHILQHGSIPYSLNRDLLKKLFPQEVDFSHITAINEFKPDLDIENFMLVLKNCFEVELKQG